MIWSRITITYWLMASNPDKFLHTKLSVSFVGWNEIRNSLPFFSHFKPAWHPSNEVNWVFLFQRPRKDLLCPASKLPWNNPPGEGEGELEMKDFQLVGHRGCQRSAFPLKPNEKIPNSERRCVGSSFPGQNCLSKIGGPDLHPQLENRRVSLVISYPIVLLTVNKS